MSYSIIERFQSIVIVQSVIGNIAHSNPLNSLGQCTWNMYNDDDKHPSQPGFEPIASRRGRRHKGESM